MSEPKPVTGADLFFATITTEERNLVMELAMRVYVARGDYLSAAKCRDFLRNNGKTSESTKLIEYFSKAKSCEGI